MSTKRQAVNTAQRGASQAAHAVTRSAGSSKDFIKKFRTIGYPILLKHSHSAY